MSVPVVWRAPFLFFLFFFNDPATTEIYTLSLHDALPILSLPTTLSYCSAVNEGGAKRMSTLKMFLSLPRSEEHTSELQSHSDLVCRLLLEKKKKKKKTTTKYQYTKNYTQQSSYTKITTIS